MMEERGELQEEKEQEETGQESTGRGGGEKEKGETKEIAGLQAMGGKFQRESLHSRQESQTQEPVGSPCCPLVGEYSCLALCVLSICPVMNW